MRTLIIFLLLAAPTHAAIISSTNLPASQNPADWLKVVFTNHTNLGVDIYAHDLPSRWGPAGTIWWIRRTTPAFTMWGQGALSVHDLTPYAALPQLAMEVWPPEHPWTPNPGLRPVSFNGVLYQIPTSAVPEPATLALALLLLTACRRPAGP